MKAFRFICAHMVSLADAEHLAAAEELRITMLFEGQRSKNGVSKDKKEADEVRCEETTELS